jgi:hypothetical protein
MSASEHDCLGTIYIETKWADHKYLTHVALAQICRVIKLGRFSPVPDQVYRLWHLYQHLEVGCTTVQEQKAKRSTQWVWNGRALNLENAGAFRVFQCHLDYTMMRISTDLYNLHGRAYVRNFLEIDTSTSMYAWNQNKISILSIFYLVKLDQSFSWNLLS